MLDRLLLTERFTVAVRTHADTVSYFVTLTAGGNRTTRAPPEVDHLAWTMMNRHADAPNRRCRICRPRRSVEAGVSASEDERGPDRGRAPTSHGLRRNLGDPAVQQVIKCPAAAALLKFS